jgi:hypothetical protein
MGTLTGEELVLQHLTVADWLLAQFTLALLPVPAWET